MACGVQRGAHTFFLRMGKVPRWGGYTVNLIHYEDAARLAAAVSRRLPLSCGRLVRSACPGVCKK